MTVDTIDTIVIGLGNPILSDDAIGWCVAGQLRAALGEDAGVRVTVQEACVGGLSLAEMLVDYDRAIIIDAIMTVNGVPGTIYHLKLPELPGTLNSASTHDTNLPTALQALRRFGAHVPPDEAIEFVAIEAEDVLTFSEDCTPDVQQSIPKAVAMVQGLLSTK
jgi:hydrogenase maturation protease